MTSRRVTYFRGDAMDDYLASLTLFRKQVAVDTTSLFRAASEQIYATQKFYDQLQECCVAYIGRHPEKFENMNQVESYMQAIAILYKRDFLIYQEIAKPPINVTNFGYSEKVILCESYGNHFDSVFTRTFQQKAAISQSLVYEIVYKGIFHMDIEVPAAVGLVRRQNQRFKHMISLSTNSSSTQGRSKLPSSSPMAVQESETMATTHDSMNLSVDAAAGSTALNQSSGTSWHPKECPAPLSWYYLGAPITMPTQRTAPNATPSRHEEAIRNKELQMAITGPPFPYKVAKALDPIVYRNIEYDVWLEEQKARNLFLKNCAFPPGANCLVRLGNSGTNVYFGVVQDVDTNGESASVYLPELRERKQVQLDRLEGCNRTAFAPASAGRGGDFERGHSRARRQTWTPTTARPQVPPATSSVSWPWNVNGMYHQPPNQEPVPPSVGYTNCGNKSGGSLTGEVPQNELATFPIPPGQPFVPNAPFPAAVPQSSQIQSNTSVPPPPFVPVNYRTPAPQQLMSAPQNFVSPCAFIPRIQEPTEEDMAILRQFYELGGCEYYRQFLAANQQYPRMAPVQARYEPPTMVFPRQQPAPGVHVPATVFAAQQASTFQQQEALLQ